MFGTKWKKSDLKSSQLELVEKIVDLIEGTNVEDAFTAVNFVRDNCLHELAEVNKEMIKPDGPFEKVMAEAIDGMTYEEMSSAFINLKDKFRRQAVISKKAYNQID